MRSGPDPITTPPEQPGSSGAVCAGQPLHRGGPSRHGRRPVPHHPSAARRSSSGTTGPAERSTAHRRDRAAHRLPAIEATHLGPAPRTTWFRPRCPCGVCVDASTARRTGRSCDRPRSPPRRDCCPHVCGRWWKEMRDAWAGPGHAGRRCGAAARWSGARSAPPATPRASTRERPASSPRSSAAAPWCRCRVVHRQVTDWRIQVAVVTTTSRFDSCAGSAGHDCPRGPQRAPVRASGPSGPFPRRLRLEPRCLYL